MKKCILNTNEVNVFINNKLYTLKNGEEYDDIISELFPSLFGIEQNELIYGNDSDVIIEIEE